MISAIRQRVSDWGRVAVSHPRRSVAWIVSGVLILYWCVLFLSTHLPMPAMEQAPAHSDKLMHFVAYGGLAFLAICWVRTLRSVRLSQYLWVAFAVAIYAAVDEALQAYVRRNPDVWDWFADCLGAALGLAAFAIVQPVLVGMVRWWFAFAERPAGSEN